MKPSWQGDDAEQRAFIVQEFGQKALDVFNRGGTMALAAYEKALPDTDPENWYRGKYGIVYRRGEERTY